MSRRHTKWHRRMGATGRHHGDTRRVTVDIYAQAHPDRLRVVLVRRQPPLSTLHLPLQDRPTKWNSWRPN